MPASSVDVLLVHGDGRFVAKVTGLLRKNAYTVLEAATPAEALAVVQGNCSPRLVVVDLEGASAGEVSTLVALQADAACGGTALLGLSRTGRDAPRLLRVDSWLLKPIEAAELVEAVRRLCGPV